ncbi:VOC family protein [Flavitalea sp. BT771]|uniref:VOC family protein n=1 Tax=Flavitalea sp. BT771 TaxID=3063329 RepID=UPI003981E320
MGHEAHNYVTFYIRVDDINDSLEKIAAAGGRKLVGPVTLPDNRKFAWFSDPEGNMVGLITK